MAYDDRLVLVEVKHSANISAIGQLVAYPMLFKESYKPELPVVPVLVAAFIPLPLRFVLDTMEIQYIELKTAHDYGVGPQIPDLFVPEESTKGNGK